MERGRVVRITDVAALAGVAPGTASKALNGTGSLRESTRERVREAADRLGFVPDVTARSLSARRSFTVGLLSTDSAGRFSLPVVLGAENALVGGELSALLATARHDPVREQHHVRALVARRVDGIIVTGRTTEPREPIRVPMPVVYAFAPSADPDDASVVPDDATGMRLLAEHLVGLGRRRIAYVGGRVEQPASTVRYETLAAELASRDLEMVGPPLYGDWSEQWGRRAVDQILGVAAASRRDGGRLPVDAIVFASDQLARGGCDRLRELGVRVPDDIAVTGYDDWEVMSLASRPPLTTVDMQLERLGQRAAELLIAAIEGEPTHGVERLAPRLVVRASTLGDG
ncbi:LacI family DNA-binding transcriptional regulator [Promicromonospora thailandica]|uniref:Transcriptional regulator, LacI family n=1 Tax=Promicromonospora thailandica TaxID=765201 RepID=A0A9X2JSP0_9MICO|nr:LacI family DNA-binding transcriptional regulator [Promicromonospora thailandica]MCP2262710.1 transcriptional regulator, LacI family [Promicromonospora thailandica]BFF18031.1 LacI family DNA-binding transcriptional regulator [Promicromonospora thailandica]